jgi:hypothetical protein
MAVAVSTARRRGTNSTLSRRRFISSIFDGGFFDEHHRDIVANGINAFARDAFQRVAVRLELDLGFASGTSKNFQEFLTNCHGVTFLDA